MMKPQEMFPEDEKKMFHVVGPEYFDPDCPLCQAFAQAPPEWFGETRFDDEGHVIMEVREVDEVLNLFKTMENHPDAWTFIKRRLPED